MEREKGQEVTSMSCPNCGGDTPLVANTDGGLAQAPCPNCFGTTDVTSRAVAAQESRPKRERATEVVAAPAVEDPSTTGGE